MHRAVVIGLGRMGISHVAIANSHPDIELVGICDVSKMVLAALRKYTKIPCFDDYKKMLDETNPDCAIIATPTRMHSAVLLDVLDRNLHVFVEKPFCLRTEEGRNIVDIVNQRNVVNQVGYHLRFIAAFNEAKRLIDSGAIGQVYHFMAESYGSLVLSRVSTWRSKIEEGGGCLYDYASHAINLIDYLIDTPVSVSGAVLKRIYSKNVEDAVYATLHFENGVSGQLAVNWSDETVRKMTNRMTILGTGGKIIVDRQECRVYRRDSDTPTWAVKYTTDLTKPTWYYLRGEEFSAQIDYFAQCLERGDTDNVNSFKTALDTDIVIEMIRNDAEGLSKPPPKRRRAWWQRLLGRS